jgi:hypothetical protein
MGWIAPKTTWANGDRFNLDPDYKRIKGNIEYLIALSKTLYPDYETPTLESPTTMDFPKASFFNNVATATRAIGLYCVGAHTIPTIRSYSENGLVWNANDLNTIERYHLYLYNRLNKERSGTRTLEYTLGGVNLGS